MDTAVITARLPSGSVQDATLACLPGKTEIPFNLRAPVVLHGRGCYHSSSDPWQRPGCYPACQVKQRDFLSNYELEWFYVVGAVFTDPPASRMLSCLPGKPRFSLNNELQWFYVGTSPPRQHTECHSACQVKQRFLVKL